MLLIDNIAQLVTMTPSAGRDGPLGIIDQAAIALDGEKVSWCGPANDIPKEITAAVHEVHDARNGIVMPGLIDAHTHLVHAGERIDEFGARARGASYQQIAAAGGGIWSTVQATRRASAANLLAAAKARAERALRYGITTIEVKSGYGLDFENELKLLRVIRDLKELSPQTIVPTLLAAHLFPPEYAQAHDLYIEMITDRLLPQVAAEGLATGHDVFVEEGAFSVAEARRLCAAAVLHGLAPRLHVDQFNDVGGGELAAEVGAISADHLDHMQEQGIAAMERGGVIAGLLPAASLFVRAGKPPVAELVAAGVPIMLATDYNPGTAPLHNLFLCGTIAVTQWGLDPDLALLAITRVAARVLNLEETHGHIDHGARGDIICLDAAHIHAPLYSWGETPLTRVYCAGRVVWEN